MIVCAPLIAVLPYMIAYMLRSLKSHERAKEARCEHANNILENTSKKKDHANSRTKKNYTLQDAARRGGEPGGQARPRGSAALASHAEALWKRVL